MGAKFKIGDRVTRGAGRADGKVLSLHNIAGHEFATVDYGVFGEWKFRLDELTLSPAQPAPLTIRAGAYYLTRDGRKVGPMEVYSKNHWYDSATGDLWRLDGSEVYDPQGDLIAEWVDEPAAVGAGSNDNGTAGFTIPIMDDEDVEPDTKLLVSISADTSALDAEIDRILRRLKKLKKKARKLSVNLEYSELLSAA